MRTRTFLYASLTAAGIGLFVACGKDPLPTSPTRLATPAVAGIQVIGPESVAAGQSVQFVANVRLADGSTKTALGMQNLRWFSSNNSVLTVSQSGMVTASASAKGGETMVTADLSNQPGVRSSRQVLVQPEGTYRVIGSVREADAPTVPIADARVEVIPGSNFAMTDSTGQYRLYGVPPESSIRITAAGYETLDEPLTLTANTTRDFGLNTNGPRLVLNGPYTVAVDIVTPCTLSAALQHRTYEAMLTTTGTLVTVDLTEPLFKLDAAGKGSRFTGRLVGGGASFTLDYYGDGYWYDYQYPNLVERLTDNTTLVVEGVATTTGTAAGLSGTLSGNFSHWSSQFPSFPQYLDGCYSSNIQFRVTPR